MSIQLRRWCQRNLFWIFLLILLTIISFSVGKAWANEPATPKSKASIADSWAERRFGSNPIPEPIQAPVEPVAAITTVSEVSTAEPVIIESHELLMESAGIPVEEWWAVELLIQKESGWQVDPKGNPNCIGMGQNCKDKNGNYWLPVACPDWQTNPVCQLRRFDEYARDRYGNWPMAWAHSQAVDWY